MQQRRGEGGRDGVGETCAEKARGVIGEVRLWWRSEGVKMLAGTGVCVAVCCSMLQCVAVCCSVWWRVCTCSPALVCLLQYDEVCCSMLQCVA